MKTRINNKNDVEIWDIVDPTTGKYKKRSIPKIRTGDPFPDPLKAESQAVACSNVSFLTPMTFLEGIKHGCHPWLESNAVIWTSQLFPAWLDPKNATYNKSILRAQGENYTIKSDMKFNEVVEACSDRKFSWITKKLKSIYKELHKLGYAHSIEVYDGENLVGGLFFVYYMGICLAESMFHYMENSSKVALTRLIWQLNRIGCKFIDSRKFNNEPNNHLLRYGFKVGNRDQYIDTLNDSLVLSQVPWRFDEDLSGNFTMSESKLMYQMLV